MPAINKTEIPPASCAKQGWPWTKKSSGSQKYELSDNNFPKISIITPSYNQGHFIEETIRSVLLQDYPDIEYIVVDGKSNDNTIEILKKYGNHLTWTSEPDEGQTDAINKGLKKSTGDIVAYLNSDDIYQPGTFLKIVHYFKNHPETAMIYGNIVHINKESDIIEYKKTRQVTIDNIFTFNVYIPQPTVFLRRSLVKNVGCFDNKLHLAMDFDYWVRVIKNCKISFLNEYLAAARIYPEAKSSSLTSGYKEEFLYIIEKIFSDSSGIHMNKLKNKATGMIYLNAARIELMKFSNKEARKNIILSFRICPGNFLSFSAIGALIISFCGVRITKFVIKNKKRFIGSDNFSV